MGKTKLEIILDNVKSSVQQDVADMYAAMDYDTKVRANYAYMDLVENVDIRNMGKVASVELAVKTTWFLRSMQGLLR